MKALRVLSILLLTIASHRAYAWGDDGHKAIALIAQNYLEPAVKTKIDAMLKADPDNLTPHDLPSEATWADKYRDSNNRRDHYQQTQNWHFVDLEINDPDIAVACFGRSALPSGTLASNGPPKACVVDKIDHKNLNLDVDFMRGIIPTSENIITAMWRELEPAVHPGRLVRLVLWETANNYVEYSGE